MKLLRYVALFSIFFIPAVYSHAQISVGIGVGPYVGDGYAYGPPVCPYGYYGYAPYACAPYGYYGPAWFSGGIFIGAGPWYRQAYYGRGYDGYRGYGYEHGYGYGRGYYGHGYGYGHDHDDYDRDGWRHDDHDRGFHRGEDFHGDHGFRGRGHGDR